MKKALSILMAFTMFLTVIPFGIIPSFAGTEQDYTYTVTSSTATITKYNGPGGDVTIPETLGGYPVTVIGSNAFEYNINLKSLVIPDNVHIIGTSAFFQCTELTSVTIGSGVSGIGMPAFGYCDKLTQLTVNSSNSCFSSQDDVIFNKAKTTLIQCAVGKAGDYAIPEGVKIIGDFAFFHCEKLTGISIPKTLTTIGTKALFLCRAMDRYIVDSENNTFSCRDDILFSKDKTLLIACPNNKSGEYVVPDTVTEICEKAFYACSKLTGVSLQNGPKTIGSEAFRECTGLNSLTIPDSVTTIKNSAFSSCPGLKNLTFGSGLTTIENFAFSGCRGLTNLTISNSVTEIKYGAFSFCSGLTAVILPENLVSIGTNAFLNCDSLKEVTIPNKVTSVGDTAFSSCDELTSVTIGDHVKNIGTNAFGDCSKLTSACFLGDAPVLKTGVFSRSASSFMIYTIRDKTGFTNPWCGYATAYYVPAPILTVSPTVPVMNSATVTVSFFNDAAVKEYRIGDGDWTAYTSPIILNSNAIVYARCTDTEGYYSANGSLVVSNIIQSTGNSYTVSYNGNGSTSGNTVVSTHAFDVSANLTVNGFVRTGYSFLGWSTDSGADSATYTDGQNVINLTQTPDNILIFYAVWSVNQYTITFDANGGTSSVPPLTLDYNSSYDLPTTGFTRKGYTFKGWGTSSDTAGTIGDYNYNVPAHNVTYYAVWAPVTYTVSFDTTGGSYVYAIHQKYSYSVMKPEDPGKEGYVFGGWYFDAELTNAVTWPYTITDDVTFYAKWNTGTSYTVTFDADGGSVSPVSKSVIFGSIYGDLPTPTKVGYVFAGWWSEKGPSIPFARIGWEGYIDSTARVTTEADHTLYAKWNAPTYLLNFDVNGATGGCILDYNIPAGTEVSFCLEPFYTVNFDFPYPDFYMILPAIALQKPSKAGYEFIGWSTSPAAACPDYWFEMPAHDVTLYAVWRESTPVFTFLTFDANGGEGGTSGFMQTGTALTPPIVTRPGYTFANWWPLAPETVPEDDTVYTAQWFANSYTITFDANGGLGGTSNVMRCGVTLTPPTVTRTGYTFAGWSPSLPATVPAGDTTYVAQWTVNHYTLNFNLNGGLGTAAVTGDYNTQVVKPPDPAKAGYTFGGWYSDAGLAAAVAWPYTIGAADVTLYAKWTTVYKLGDINNNGSVSILDALITLRYVTGTYVMTDNQTAAADVDGSGTVTILDALKILQYATGLRTSF